MLPPWGFSSTCRWSLPATHQPASSHGLSWSSDPLSQLPAGFSHQNELSMLFKAEFIIFPSKLFSYFLFLLNSPAIAPSLEVNSGFSFLVLHPLPSILVQSHLISHKTQRVDVLSIFLNVSLLYITQPCYFLPGPLQELHSWSPQLPTNLFFTLWPEWWAHNNTSPSKHAPPECPSDTRKTQTRCIHRAYRARLQASYIDPPKHILSTSWYSPERPHCLTVLCPYICHLYSH